MKKGLWICLIISSVLFFFYSLGHFQTFDNYLYDYLQQNIDLESSSDKFIIVVEIDDSSLNKLGVWPLPRSYYAQLLNVLNKGGAKVIAFDINFDSYSSYSKEEDLVFAYELNKAKNVILARDYYFEYGKLVIRDPIKELKNHSILAMVDPVLDKDSLIRRYKMYAVNEYESFLYFALQASLQYLGLDKSKVLLKENKFFIDNKEIPLDRNGRMLIKYSSLNNGISVVPLFQVLNPTFLDINKDYFKNKIVLVGATASYLQDNFPTPVDLNMPGVLIHANAIRTIINQEFIRLLYPFVYLFVIFLLVGLIYFVTTVVGSLMGFVFLSVIIILTVLVQRFLYIQGFYLECVVLAFSSVISYMVAFFMKFLMLIEEKLRIKAIFKQYVSPNIVERFISGEEDLAAEGKERVVSVLFVDIVGFTSFCEEETPINVVSQLNEILNVLTEEVFKHNGTLDKFMGDSLMAVWGSPLEQENHAELALNCAIKMIESVKKLHLKWIKENKRLFEIGVSISSGQVVAGNIGAKKHKDYTVIGDVVNIASRLQVLNRESGYFIVFEEKTKDLIKDKFEVKKIGDVQVKGKKNKVSAWTVE